MHAGSHVFGDRMAAFLGMFVSLSGAVAYEFTNTCVSATFCDCAVATVVYYRYLARFGLNRNAIAHTPGIACMVSEWRRGKIIIITIQYASVEHGGTQSATQCGPKMTYVHRQRSSFCLDTHSHITHPCVFTFCVSLADVLQKSRWDFNKWE